MKRAVALVVCLGILPAVAWAAPASERLTDLLWDFNVVPLEGQQPPPLALSSLDGRAVSLADLRGRAVLLYFWTST